MVISELNVNSVDPDLRRLLWVYTVCQCPLYRALGINGLTVAAFGRRLICILLFCRSVLSIAL